VRHNRAMIGAKLMIRGSLSKITSMIPGMSGMMEEGGEEEASAKLKRMIFITDAMRADELDSDGLIFVSSPMAPCEVKLIE